MEKLKKLFWQFFKFGLVGVSGTIVNNAVYMILIAINCNMYIAIALGYIVSVFSSYILQSRFVFVNGEHSKERLIKAYLGYLPGLFLSFVLSWLYTDILLVPKIWALLLTVPITVPLNFLLQKKWAYKE